jgi:hypothetical protein
MNHNPVPPADLARALAVDLIAIRSWLEDLLAKITQYPHLRKLTDNAIAAVVELENHAKSLASRKA